MSVSEAAQLVIQSSSLSQGGEVFLLDMGRPVMIVELAKRIIEQQGYRWRLNNEKHDVNSIKIKFIGLRKGEKLYEELLLDRKSEVTSHPKIFKSQEALGESTRAFNANLKILVDAIKNFDEEYVESYIQNYLFNEGIQEVQSL